MISMSRPVAKSTFLIVCLFLILPYSNSFERECKEDDDCTFGNRTSFGRVYFPCINDKCECRVIDSDYDDVIVNDPFNYQVEEVNGECIVKKHAPCGESNGISLTCGDKDKKCIEGICRFEKRANIDEFCYDDFDCEDGLSCIRISIDLLDRVCLESSQEE